MATPDLHSERIGLAHELLLGKVAVVTGAGRGIGQAVAEALARAGARVVIAEIAESGQATAERIQAAGGSALFVRTDVSREEDVAALAQATEASYGPVDILINNAIVAPVAPVLELEVAAFDRALAVNLRGAFLTCKAFVPAMVSRGAGVVINMVSTDAMPTMSAYIAAKKGLEGFTHSLAAEVGPSGVQVVALAPGFVDTPGLRESGEKLAPALGLSVTEFMQLPLHEGYTGPMPAADAALATVYLAAVLAGEYHGETVTGYGVLERAGILSPAVEAAESKPQSQRVQTAMELCTAVAAALVQTEAEFERLPIFVRPLARSGFKAKAGRSLPDWKQAIYDLTRKLQWVQEGEQKVGDSLLAEQGTLVQGLKDLARYFREVPNEVARFTKDQAVLAEAHQVAGARVSTLQALVESLERLQG